MLDDAATRRTGSRSRRQSCLLAQPTFFWLRPEEARCRALQLRPGQPRLLGCSAGAKNDDRLANIHSMAFADDGTVYICNRYGNQIRLYDKMGNFKRTFDYPWQPATVPADGKIEQSGGATVALALSRDPAQTFLFVVNQNNSRVDIVERQSGKIVSTLGQIGNLPGQFNQPHSVAVDSRNNLYIGENRGRRIHKFTPKT
jgi:DNA-binding beta-propeller fold protein YncE